MTGILEILMATDDELTRLAPLVIIIFLMGAGKVLQYFAKKSSAKADSQPAPGQAFPPRPARPEKPPRWVQEMFGIEQEVFETPEEEPAEELVEPPPRVIRQAQQKQRLPEAISAKPVAQAPQTPAKYHPEYVCRDAEKGLVLDLRNIQQAQKAFIYHEVFFAPKALRDEPQSWEL